MAVQFILCRFTICSPLFTIQLNVNSEITSKQHKPKLFDKKMSVEHTQLKLQTTEINFEKL